MAAQPAADPPALASRFELQRQIIALLSADGIILEANRTLLAALGFAEAEVIGRRFVEAGWPQAEGRRLEADIAQAAGGTPVRREIVLSGPDGELCLDFSLQPVRDPASGAVSLLIAESRDDTPRRSLAVRLAQTQKMQALGELASGMAHDFNNVLQTIAGAAELIELKTAEDGVRRLTGVILKATARGGSVTERLLAFSLRREPRLEALAVAEVLHGMREVLVHTIGPAITVIAGVPDGLPSVLADRGQLETGLVNLAANSRDAMPNGGRLTLSAALVQVGDAGGPQGLAGGDYVRIDVADTGGGMDAATLARAGEPFYTTKPPGRGTGLGLPMVKEFAERSGGAMTIASTPEGGTTVGLWLPAAATVARAAGVRDLLVDDEAVVCETLAAQLRGSGVRRADRSRRRRGARPDRGRRGGGRAGVRSVDAAHERGRNHPPRARQAGGPALPAADRPCRRAGHGRPGRGVQRGPQADQGRRPCRVHREPPSPGERPRLKACRGAPPGRLAGGVARRGRHALEALAFAAERDPGLGTAAPNLGFGPHPGGVVERAGEQHHEVGHDGHLGRDAGAAVRAETAVHRPAGLAGILVGPYLAFDLDLGLRHAEHRLEGGAGEALAVAAVADAGEDGRHLAPIAHAAAQAAAHKARHLRFLFPRSMRRSAAADRRRRKQNIRYAVATRANAGRLRAQPRPGARFNRPYRAHPVR